MKPSKICECPKEVLARILLFTDFAEDFSRFRLVCPRFRAAADSDAFWCELNRMILCREADSEQQEATQQQLPVYPPKRVTWKQLSRHFYEDSVAKIARSSLSSRPLGQWRELINCTGAVNVDLLQTLELVYGPPLISISSGSMTETATIQQQQPAHRQQRARATMSMSSNAISTAVVGFVLLDDSRSSFDALLSIQERLMGLRLSSTGRKSMMNTVFHSSSSSDESKRLFAFDLAPRVSHTRRVMALSLPPLSSQLLTASEEDDSLSMYAAHIASLLTLCSTVFFVHTGRLKSTQQWHKRIGSPLPPTRSSDSAFATLENTPSVVYVRAERDVGEATIRVAAQRKDPNTMDLLPSPSSASNTTSPCGSYSSVSSQNRNAIQRPPSLVPSAGQATTGDPEQNTALRQTDITLGKIALLCGSSASDAAADAASLGCRLIQWLSFKCGIVTAMHLDLTNPEVLDRPLPIFLRPLTPKPSLPTSATSSVATSPMQQNVSLPDEHLQWQRALASSAAGARTPSPSPSATVRTEILKPFRLPANLAAACGSQLVLSPYHISSLVAEIYKDPSKPPALNNFWNENAISRVFSSLAQHSLNFYIQAMQTEIADLTRPTVPFVIEPDVAAQRALEVMNAVDPFRIPRSASSSRSSMTSGSRSASAASRGRASSTNNTATATATAAHEDEEEESADPEAFYNSDDDVDIPADDDDSMMMDDDEPPPSSRRSSFASGSRSGRMTADNENQDDDDAQGEPCCHLAYAFSANAPAVPLEPDEMISLHERYFFSALRSFQMQLVAACNGQPAGGRRHLEHLKAQLSGEFRTFWVENLDRSKQYCGELLEHLYVPMRRRFFTDGQLARDSPFHSKGGLKQWYDAVHTRIEEYLVKARGHRKYNQLWDYIQVVICPELIAVAQGLSNSNTPTFLHVKDATNAVDQLLKEIDAMVKRCHASRDASLLDRQRQGALTTLLLTHEWNAAAYASERSALTAMTGKAEEWNVFSEEKLSLIESISTNETFVRGVAQEGLLICRSLGTERKRLIQELEHDEHEERTEAMNVSLRIPKDAIGSEHMTVTNAAASPTAATPPVRGRTEGQKESKVGQFFRNAFRRFK